MAALAIQMDDRPMLFSSDLTFFLCCEYRINWLPVGSQLYCCNPLSPFTAEIGQVVRFFVIHYDEDFRIAFVPNFPIGVGYQSDQFLDYAMSVLEVSFPRGIGTAQTFLLLITYIAKASILLYMRRPSDVIDVARRFIGHAIKRHMLLNGTGFFDELVIYARTLIFASIQQN